MKEKQQKDPKILQWWRDYEQSLHQHIANVREAGRRLHVPETHLLVHDMSKWSLEEFPFYARQFHGDKGDPVGFARAWLHHQNHNPHHWEYWITRSDHSHGAGGAVNDCLAMPENYLREMIADWMGASKSYTGSWDISEWLTKNLYRIRIHPDTLDLLYAILCDELEYHCYFDTLTSKFIVQTEPFQRDRAIQP